MSVADVSPVPLSPVGTACPHIGICRPYGTQQTQGIRILQICRSYGAENRYAVRHLSKTFRSTDFSCDVG
ncbi:hypothetical protein QUF75_04375 [Desulfococcaceae bacterium HSG7]|nr:hypothetical protein [Desulfococcaceae bacterium HSG7]